MVVRDAVRAIGCTDATPFMENTDAIWATIAAWNEDAADTWETQRSSAMVMKLFRTTKTKMKARKVRPEIRVVSALALGASCRLVTSSP